MRGKVLLLALAGALGTALAGVGAASAGSPSRAQLPSAMAALGDSLTRAYGALGAPSDQTEESWSTGSDPVVGSQYLRLLALNPALAGRAFDDAQSGTTMQATAAQAAAAVAQLSAVPGPVYVTIESGTNDVCTATTAQMTSVGDFANALRTTLTTLTAALPSVEILVLSIPDWYGFWHRYHDDPAATAAWSTYSDRCPDLLGATATTADREAVDDRIRQLNDAIAAVCASFPACSDDHGATYRLWPSLRPDELTFDFFHPTVTGEADLADQTWKHGTTAVLRRSAKGRLIAPVRAAPKLTRCPRRH